MVFSSQTFLNEDDELLFSLWLFLFKSWKGKASELVFLRAASISQSSIWTSLHFSLFSGIGKCRLHVDLFYICQSTMKYRFFHEHKPHNPKSLLSIANMKRVEIKIVDHKLWRSKAARAVRKTSNRNQMTVPRHVTALYKVQCVLPYFRDLFNA